MKLKVTSKMETDKNWADSISVVLYSMLNMLEYAQKIYTKELKP